MATIAAHSTDPKTRPDSPRTPEVSALTHSDVLHLLYLEAQLNKIQVSRHRELLLAEND